MYDQMDKAWASELERLLWLDVSLMGTRYGCETGDYICGTPNTISFSSSTEQLLPVLIGTFQITQRRKQSCCKLEFSTRATLFPRDF